MGLRGTEAVGSQREPDAGCRRSSSGSSPRGSSPGLRFGSDSTWPCGLLLMFPLPRPRSRPGTRLPHTVAPGPRGFSQPQKPARPRGSSGQPRRSVRGRGQRRTIFDRCGKRMFYCSMVFDADLELQHLFTGQSLKKLNKKFLNIKGLCSESTVNFILMNKTLLLRWDRRPRIHTTLTWHRASLLMSRGKRNRTRS